MKYNCHQQSWQQMIPKKWRKLYKWVISTNISKITWNSTNDTTVSILIAATGLYVLCKTFFNDQRQIKCFSFLLFQVITNTINPLILSSPAAAHTTPSGSQEIISVSENICCGNWYICCLCLLFLLHLILLPATWSLRSVIMAGTCCWVQGQYFLPWMPSLPSSAFPLRCSILVSWAGLGGGLCFRAQETKWISFFFYKWKPNEYLIS